MATPVDVCNPHDKAEMPNIPDLKCHIFLCCDQSKPRCCSKEDGLTSWDYLKLRLKELGLTGVSGVYRTKVNCLRICRSGPIMLIYPDGAWYHSCTPEVIERIIQEHVINNTPVEEYIFAKKPLER